MNLTLAIVETCGPQGCEVKMWPDGRSLFARYSALVVDRVKIRPGQMVAVDLDPAEPEVAWRWYRAVVASISPGNVKVEERARQLDAVEAPGLETGLSAGDEVWVTGMEGAWEIHDRVMDGGPADAERLYLLVLPRIAGLLSAAPAA